MMPCHWRPTCDIPFSTASHQTCVVSSFQEAYNATKYCARQNVIHPGRCSAILFDALLGTCLHSVFGKQTRNDNQTCVFGSIFVNSFKQKTMNLILNIYLVKLHNLSF